jgi:electron-transferring-flavoprotein dehydrogenase
MAAVEGCSRERMVGVWTGDRVNRKRKPKANFEPGSDIRAKVTILAEGARIAAGRLTPGLQPDAGRAPRSRHRGRGGLEDAAGRVGAA